MEQEILESIKFIKEIQNENQTLQVSCEHLTSLFLLNINHQYQQTQDQCQILKKSYDTKFSEQSYPIFIKKISRCTSTDNEKKSPHFNSINQSENSQSQSKSPRFVTRNTSRSNTIKSCDSKRNPQIENNFSDDSDEQFQYGKQNDFFNQVKKIESMSSGQNSDTSAKQIKNKSFKKFSSKKKNNQELQKFYQKKDQYNKNKRYKESDFFQN